MNVSAIIVTRGDVDLDPVLASLPDKWEKIVWDNSPIKTFAPEYHCRGWVKCEGPRARGVPDLAVYGRYAAIEFASHELVYVQDDDVIVSDPQAIVDAWHVSAPLRTNHLVANMPAEFRHDGYTDSCLVGFGACFHRDAPRRAFDRFGNILPLFGLSDYSWWLPPGHERDVVPEKFLRTCDVIFTTLTPRVLVDVPKVNREFAYHESRMWRQPGHVEERRRMLELARKVRDA